MADAGLSAFLERLGGIAYEFDPSDRRVTTFDGAVLAITGHQADEFKRGHRRWPDLVHPDDLPNFEAEGLRLMTVPGAQTRCVYRIRHREGHLLWVEDAARRIDDEGRTRVVGTVRDVTDRVRAEQAAGRSERQLRDTLDNLELVTVTLDRSGRITYCNRHLSHLTGWSERELLGMDFHGQLCPREDLSRVPFERWLAAEEAPGHHEGTLLTRGGEGRIMRWASTLVRDADGAVVGLSSIGEDITERRRAEEQLLQTSKLESLGRLAGGIAHDFNNLLTAIIGSVDLALLRLEPRNARVRPELETVREAADRAGHLTRQLLAFARRQVITPRRLEVREVVGGLLKILRRLVGEHVVIVTEPGVEVWPVFMDPAQLEQVLVNLALNARDAMPNGGTLRIGIANAVVSERDVATRAEVRDLRPGEYVTLVVSDTGVGMEEDVRQLAFEPFFTTKAVGQGTGLGLATCLGIVKQNRGHIHIDSAPGEGTQVTIYLPRSHTGDDARMTLPSAEDLRGHETLLLVEDEALVRGVAVASLRSRGYIVLEAENGDAGLTLARDHAGPIHLLVTDVVMPGLNGPQLAERMESLRPQLRVLYVSGYADVASGPPLSLRPGDHFLEKPYSPDGLARAVRAALKR